MRVKKYDVQEAWKNNFEGKKNKSENYGKPITLPNG
jgi:hypothetical protein